MLPLKQYGNQIGRHPLWEKLHGSLIPQLEYDLWYKLLNELQNELGEETLIATLEEELRDKCSR